MCPRPYQMKRRNESAQETRQRIVQATYELHSEKGIAATSVRDIAQRADVAVGSVYHHFPSYDDIITACGAYTLDRTQPPTKALLDDIGAPAARLQALVQSVFDYYARSDGLERIRADRDKFALVDEFLVNDENNRRELLRLALAPHKPGKAKMALAMAVLDVAFHRSLVGDGLSQQAAVAATSELLCKLLLPDGDEAAARKKEAGRRRSPLP